jgi:hypothetical protein
MNCIASWSRALGGALVLLAIVGYTPPADACACCSDPGERFESTAKIEPLEMRELGRVRFGRQVRVYENDAWPEHILGINEPSTSYDLAFARTGDRWTFTLKDAKGRTGTLSFVTPVMLESFFADLHDQKPNTDVALYKEWRLKAQLSATGIFAGAGAATIRLILQGRGNSCTDAAQFKNFTIDVTGPTARFTLFGNLAAPAP